MLGSSGQCEGASVVRCVVVPIVFVVKVVVVVVIEVVLVVLSVVESPFIQQALSESEQRFSFKFPETQVEDVFESQ